MKHLFTILLILIYSLSFSQVITFTPEYPTVDDTITIIYDASLGNGALNGVSPIYAHTGIISNFSSTLSDWQHKIAKWGVADSLVLMENIGNNKHKIKFQIADFYGVGYNTGEVVRELAFVFRNADGTIAGKNSDETDFYIHVYNSDARFMTPMEFPLNPQLNQSINVLVESIGNSLINLYHDNTLIKQAYGTSCQQNILVGQTGKHWIWFQSEHSGKTVVDSIYYIVKQNSVVANLPSGIKDGINYINDTTVTLCLYAPYKNFVYLIGDFNDWQPEPSYLLNKTPDGKRYWITLNNLEKNKEYRFQYYVDLDVKIGDPYAEKLLDQYGDVGINNIIYPDLIKYPTGKTAEMVSVLQTAQTPYNWTDAGFTRPDNRDLVIYELLVRDFSIRHDFKTVLDSIDHLVDLGVNAIELMPVMEFDGNDGWGYGPAYFFAPDKYYGTREALKNLINKAHEKGIAIILDIVLNHAFGQNPWVKLYYDRATNNVTTQNPWFNNFIPHPFGFKYDFNHASPETKAFVDSVFGFWTHEYHADGFRLDLSKGLTNNNTGDNVGWWGEKDTTRINILNRMYDRYRTYVDSSAYFILEHFANNEEESLLAGHGFMLWGKANSSYGDATMGWSSNFEFDISYKNRGWAFHNLVGYMESHDEERLMYKNLTFGNSAGDYDTKELKTALKRMELGAAFFLTVPGPKMIWQFGELGYDFSINYPSMTEISRTTKKPVRWTYKLEPDRLHLYKVYAALCKLKTEYPLFRTSNFEMSVGNYDKRIKLWDDGNVNSNMSAVVLGNFDVASQTVWPEFYKTGYWYDYLSGDSIYVDNTGMTLQYEAGEFHIYTDVKLPKPDLSVPSYSELINNPDNSFSYVSPNPFNSETTINFNLTTQSDVSLKIFDIQGRIVKNYNLNKSKAGENQVTWNGTNNQDVKVDKGYYMYKIETDNEISTGKILFY